jgi:hypothetical protein
MVNEYITNSIAGDGQIARDRNSPPGNAGRCPFQILAAPGSSRQKSNSTDIPHAASGGSRLALPVETG